MPAARNVTFSVVELRSDQDLIGLVRQTRAAAATLRLPSREIRGLSAATYEYGRLLLGSAGLSAEVRASGNCLYVAFHRPIGDHDERESVWNQVREAAGALDRMVSDVEVDTSGSAVKVALAVELGRQGEDDVDGRLAMSTPGAASADADHLSPADLRRAYERLSQAFRDLQIELNETNRGVVALHAELEAQADDVRQAEDRLRLLLDSVQDHAICMLTPAGDVASWNAGAERLFGYGAEEIVGRSFARFYEPADRDLEIPLEQLRRARDRGRVTDECRQVRRDGSGFDADVTLTIVSGEPRGAGFALVVRDVTDRKRLERDLRRRAEDLAAANRAKEEFLATLSHELRTPLNAMLGWTRLLRLGRLDGSDMARALETIERNARVQEQLIADILDVSRIVTGKLRLELRPVELLPVIEAAMDAVRPAAEAKGVYLTLDRTASATVLGDADRLQQVVWNLLVNAIKFTPPEGRITLSITQDGPTARVTVADTGEGVSPELLPVIFDRFTQGDTSATRPHGGLGLGLSIVRHIVELHGGRVQAYSEGRARGATFVVHLPIRAVRQTTAPRPPESADPLRGIRVLIVDDDEDAREVVALALSQCGAETAAASSAREALRLLPEFRPHVLVSDIGMPGEDGYSLIRRIRALGVAPLRDVPAVALTAYAQPEDQRRALGAGFQKFVPKPVEVQELAAVVRMLV